MERPKWISLEEFHNKHALLEYGGPEGLVYHGLRLASLTPEQRIEYFGLKREESDLDVKIGDKESEAIFKDSSPKIPGNLNTRYKQVQRRLKELEKIMDEKVPITKGDFFKELYL